MIEKFLIPEIVFGKGVLQQVGMAVQRLAGTRVLLVSDYGLADSGWVEKAAYYLKKEGIFYTSYLDISPNPRDYEVEKALDLYLQEKCDLIVALGGGSPMDVAKGLAILANNGGKIQDYEGLDKAYNPLPPMVMIPSTNGTGSEVSQFSIIKDSGKQKKMTLMGKNLVPNIALVDPLISLTGSDYLQACCGMDALTHAIESYVSVAASDFTHLYSLKSIQLIREALTQYKENGIDKELITMMSRASLFAGIAFSNASLGLVHAMAHQLGGLLDIAHGEANAILLPYVMEYNLPVAVDGYAKLALAWGIGEKGDSPTSLAQSAIRNVRKLGTIAGTPADLKKYSLTEEQLENMAANTLQDPCILTNPRQADKEDVLNIFLAASGKKTLKTIKFKDQVKSMSLKNVEDLVGVHSSKLNYYGQLKEQMEKVHLLNQELEKKVLERTAQLEAANRDLESFSYSVSHDLRAPLRAIDGFSRIILEDYSYKIDGEGQRYLNIIRYNTQRMGQLIDDLLAFSRLGRKQTEKSQVNMHELAQTAFEEAFLEKREGNSVIFELSPLPIIYGDRNMLRQVMLNLFSNALKFTRYKEKALIQVGYQIEEEEIIYYIADNGVGFDMQYSDKLFSVFQRLHSTEEFEGTGVGLAIVQRIIQRHGGRTWAKSKPNQGATFYFALPKNKDIGREKQ